MKEISVIFFCLTIWMIDSLAVGRNIPRVERGTLDLRTWDFDVDETINMSGEWEFYWSRLLEPSEFEGANPDNKEWIVVPSSWNDVKNYPQNGFATYRVRVRLTEIRPLAVKWSTIYSASKIYIGNKLLVENGKVHESDDPQLYQPRLTEQLKTFIPESRDFYIVIQAVNYDVFLGGVAKEAPVLGVPNAIARQLQRDTGINLLLVGSIFVMGLYHLFIFALRTKSQSSMYFGLLCLSCSIYSLATKGRPISVFFPEISFRALIMIFNVWILGVPAFSLFTYKLFPKLFSKRFAQIVSILCLSYFFVVASTEPRFYLRFTVFIQALAVITLSYTLLTSFRAILRKEVGARLYLFGLLVFGIAGLNDMLLARALIETIPLATIGLFIFIICQSLLLARKFSDAFARVESSEKEIRSLSENLQIEVEKQTSILKNQRDLLVEQKAELSQAHQDLQKYDQRKTHFFQNISHELRTPLTLILGSLSHVMPAVEGAVKEDLVVAQRNAKRLLRLVNQLLDFQKISAGKVSAEFVKLDLRHFIQVIASYFMPTCKQQSIRFEVCDELDDTNINTNVLVSIDYIEKILFNYLSNALKYTTEGGRISLHLQRCDDHQLRCLVQDEGPGIAEDKLDQLFQVFSQVDGSEQREYEGTGLGLALCKELAEAMGGRVGVKSTPAIGSCFWVDLPICYEESDRIGLLVVLGERHAKRDFEENFIKACFKHSVEIVQSAKQAYKLISERPIDCIMSDALLTDGEGAALLSFVGIQQPHAKRLLMTDRDQGHRLVQSAINTAHVHQVFYHPLGEEVYGCISTLIDEVQIQHEQKVIDLLVVDDEEKVFIFMREALLESSHIGACRFVSSEDEAVDILTHYRVRCLVCDIRLQSSDGTELMAKAAKLQPDCRRVAITGASDPEIISKAVSVAKIDRVFYKPFQKDEFIAGLEDLVRSSPIAEKKEIQTIDSSKIQFKDWHLSDTTIKANQPLANDHDEHQSGTAKILVVDDVDDMRSLIRSNLKESGYRVVEARNGSEALGQLHKEKIDLVITDWMMPQMTGPELLSHIQSDEQTAGIPTILLTAKGDDISKVVAVQKGASAYLAKPFDAIELNSVVVNLLKLKEGERKIRELNNNLTENILTRFIPPSLIDSLIKKGNFDLLKDVRMQSVTILFSDICQFTQISEDLGPKQIARILNLYFEEMTNVIFGFNGTIDKFIGDAIMVIFGAPIEVGQEEQARKASACALAMQERLADLNERWKSEGLPALRMRIGIHQGPAIVGMFGGKQRSEYTAMGPTVNMASRIEQCAEPGSVFMSSVVRDYIDESSWQKAGSFELKGIGNATLYRLSEQLKNEAA